MAFVYVSPSLLRRIAAGIYDLLLVIALWFPATAIALMVFRDGRVMPEFLYRLYLLAVAFAFFGWFWTHGGQTLGMRAWRLKLVGGDGNPPAWGQAMVRYFGMLIPWLLIGLGLEFIVYPAAGATPIFRFLLAPCAFITALAGFIWPLLDKQRLGWQDRLSRSCPTVLPKPVKTKKSAKPADRDQATQRE